MAEIMEEKNVQTPAETAAPAEAAAQAPAKKPEKSPADKKKRRRLIRRIIAIAVIAALAVGGVRHFSKKNGGSSEVGKATVPAAKLVPQRWNTAPSVPWWTAAVW